MSPVHSVTHVFSMAHEKWLRLSNPWQTDPYTKNLVCLRLRVNFGSIFGKHGRKRLVEPPLLEAYQRQKATETRTLQPPPIQKLLIQAYQLKERLASTGLIRSALAEEMSLDPSRITQILNLLNLAPAIRR